MRTQIRRKTNMVQKMAYVEYAYSFARKNALRITGEAIDLEQGLYAENSIHDPNRGRPRC